MTSKRPQIRRCGICHNTGHNKATCPEFLSPSPTPKAATPLKFFIHHVNTPPPTSSHVVDLKSEQADVWKKIESSAPNADKETIFHSYHHTPAPKELDKSFNNKLFSDLNNTNTKKSAVRLPRINLKPREVKAPIKITKADIKKVAEKFAPSRLAMAVILIFTLSLSIPGPLQGYFESLAQTKDDILQSSTAGFTALQESAAALKEANLQSAEIATASALSNFNAALSTLTTRHTVLQTVVKILPVIGTQLSSREKVLLAGEQIAIGNSYLLKGLKEVENNEKLPVTEKLNILVAAIRNANPSYEEASTNLRGVDPSVLPAEYRGQFEEFNSLLGNLVEDFTKIANLNDTFQEIFGGKGLRRYLLIFQNPAELRPTGGFMGSFAILDVKDGEIKNLEIPPGGTYDLKGQLSEYVIPPLPLTINDKRWEFQDANWFPDFPASAQKILWFFNHSRNVTADGVISINASVLEKILEVVGPLNDQDRGLSLSSNNVLTTLQTVVEKGPEKSDNKPKQILADLAPKVILAMQSAQSKNLLPLLGALEDSLNTKDIQAYFTDSDVQKKISESHWSGSIISTGDKTDYLMVVNTNLQGQKSDARIKQLISHQALIEEDGSIVDTVTVTREHTGDPTEEFYGSPNIDYLRFYVPEGSTLISASGFTWPDEKNFRAPETWYTLDSDLLRYEKETGIDSSSGTRITSEFGKTAFGNWIVTEPGQVSRVEITYRLPFKITSEQVASDDIWNKFITSLDELNTKYQLAVQKQSGITSYFESQIIFPVSWQPGWVNGKNVSLASNGLNILKLPLSEDSIWGILMKKPNK
jgi:hypothetical protein